MKRLLTALLLALSSVAFGATLTPIQLLSPAGSTAGQVIASTGVSSAPAWTTVTLSGLSGTLAIANGGTGGTTQATARTGLGLGTSATVNTGTSGATIPLLSTANTWTLAQAFSVRPTFNGATPWDSSNLPSVAGRLLNVQVFSASGTYTPTAGTTKVIAEVQAPGGGGGGVAATSASQNAIAQGGSGGSYAQVYWTSPVSVTVTIGAIGSAGAAGTNAGGNGGTTSIGSVVSCPGGIGGAGSAAQATGFTQNGAASPAGCTITGPTAIRNVAGGTSAPVTNMSSAAAYVVKGGYGVMGYNSSGGNGSGGDGAAIPASTGATAGGAGVGGKVVLYEYN